MRGFNSSVCKNNIRCSNLKLCSASEMCGDFRQMAFNRVRSKILFAAQMLEGHDRTAQWARRAIHLSLRLTLQTRVSYSVMVKGLIQK